MILEGNAWLLDAFRPPLAYFPEVTRCKGPRCEEMGFEEGAFTKL